MFLATAESGLANAQYGSQLISTALTLLTGHTKPNNAPTVNILPCLKRPFLMTPRDRALRC